MPYVSKKGVFVMSKNNGKHFTYDDRLVIEKGITNSATKKSIAQTLGRPISSIAYEIKTRRTLTYKGEPIYSCKYLKTCRPGKCYMCEKYELRVCKRRDRSPGACNGCPTISSCRIDHYRYDAKGAQLDYEETLSDARQGVNLTLSEAQKISDIVKPELERGLAPYVIINKHPELNISEKTLYTYIDNDILPGIGNLDLHSKVKYKLQKSGYKRRTNDEREYLNGREYKDYEKYIEEHNIKDVMLMDTVEGGKGEKVMTTFYLVREHFLFGVLQDDKKASSVLDTIDMFFEKLGLNKYRKLFHVILTDRGPEFAYADDIETIQNKEKDAPIDRGRIFYCDAMQSWQKAEIENAHRDIRIYLSKGTSFNNLTQLDLDKMFTHIANYPLESLEGRTPYETFTFYYPNISPTNFGVERIEYDDIIRKPYLLK